MHDGTFLGRAYTANCNKRNTINLMVVDDLDIIMHTSFVDNAESSLAMFQLAPLSTIESFWVLQFLEARYSIKTCRYLAPLTVIVFEV